LSYPLRYMEEVGGVPCGRLSLYWTSPRGSRYPGAIPLTRLAVSVIGQLATLLFVVGSHPMSPAAATTGSVAAAAGWAVTTVAAKARNWAPKRTRTPSAAPADLPRERRRPERTRDAMLHCMERIPPCSWRSGTEVAAAARPTSSAD